MSTDVTFKDLDLPEPILNTLNDLGYESPTPIQAHSIPVLLKGDDVLAQAQTGTGKTAAFALPILSQLDLKLKQPQALVIAPTRELAIQVAEAFQSYAKRLNGFNVCPIYGGQDYSIQLKALKRGAQVVVGTPGRMMDHMRRGTIDTATLKMVVLDEADEMLKMGFIDDIEWILEQIPNEHQTALFSATMPVSIQKIAKRYLKNAEKIQIKATTESVAKIEQSYMRVSSPQKMEALTRYLESETIEAAIIFSRTKTMSQEVADKLLARGYAASALNGDMKQSQREKVIGRIKKGTLDIIVATDVAARGIDVERVTHVINYDIPTDTESYVHRIGRTGRAGRSGKALLFVSPRETRLLKDIERAINKKIKQVEPPTIKELSDRRNIELVTKVTNIIAKSKNLKPFQELVSTIQEQESIELADIAAAFAYLLAQETTTPLTELDTMSAEPERRHKSRSNASRPGDKNRRGYENRKTGGSERSGEGNKSRSGGKPGGSKFGGSKPSGSKYAGSKPSGSKPSGSKYAGTKPSGARPSDDKSGGSKPPAKKKTYTAKS